MKKISEALTAMVAAEAEKAGVFIVGQSHGLQGLYRYYIDSEGALNMLTLTELTRKVSALIDEADLGDEAFTFEISSPGADKPLTDIRQFGKHVGRTFKIEPTEGEEFEGVLKAVNGNVLSFEKKIVTKEKGKKTETLEMTEIPFDQINSATIKLVFK